MAQFDEKPLLCSERFNLLQTGFLTIPSVSIPRPVQHITKFYILAELKIKSEKISFKLKPLHLQQGDLLGIPPALCFQRCVLVVTEPYKGQAILNKLL